MQRRANTTPKRPPHSPDTSGRLLYSRHASMAPVKTSYAVLVKKYRAY